MTVEQYEDEFDELADKRTLSGSHRRKRNPLVAAAPLVAALVLAPLAGWGVVEMMSQDGMSNPFITEDPTEEAGDPAEPDETAETNDPTEDSGDDTVDASPSDEPGDDLTEGPDGDTETDEATDEPTEEPTDEETEEPIETLPPVPGVTYDASIVLNNGTGIPGGSDAARTSLLTAGYTEIEDGTLAGGTPAYSAIYFSSPDLYATAQNLAQTLNIDFWAENPGMTGTDDIVIIIR